MVEIAHAQWKIAKIDESGVERQNFRRHIGNQCLWGAKTDYFVTVHILTKLWQMRENRAGVLPTWRKRSPWSRFMRNKLTPQANVNRTIEIKCLEDPKFITQCLKKTAKLFLLALRQISTNFDIFGRNMAKRLKLCKVHSFSSSPNSRHHTMHVKRRCSNCYTTLKVVMCKKLSNDLISTQ